jgi:hypothetical protein
MNFSKQLLLSTPAGETWFNPGDGVDGFRLTTETTGFDQAGIRATVDDRSQTDGGIVHPFRKSARRLTIVAQYLIETGTIADRDDAFDALEAQLDSILAEDGRLFQEHFVAAGSPPNDSDTRWLVVRSEIPLVSSGGPQLKQAAFGLVAADPAWVNWIGFEF